MSDPTPLELQQQELARLRIRARWGDDAVQERQLGHIPLPDGLEIPPDLTAALDTARRIQMQRAEIEALHRYLWCVAMQQGGSLSVTDAEMAECPQGAVLTTARKGDVLRVWARPASMLRPVDISDDDDERSLKRVPTRPSTEADEAEDVW